MDTRRRFLSKQGGGSYIVNLNYQWEKTTSVPNPNSFLYDGVYRSSSNYNVGESIATMYITIKDCPYFHLYIRSSSEYSDYVMVSHLDQAITESTSYSNTAVVKAHTFNKIQTGTALSNYTLIEFTGITSGTHVITVVYKKDITGNQNADRGYVLIPKIYPGSVVGEIEDLDTTYSIRYTSQKGVVAPYDPNVFGATLTNNVYVGGQGIITFDNPVTQIGEKAFYSCQNITDIVIPDSVTSIGYNAFWCCYGLTTFTFPKSLKTINKSAFSSCRYITDIYFDSCSVTIGNSAFSGCNALTKIHVKTIEDWFKVNLSYSTNLFSSKRSLYVNNVKVTDFPEITTSTSIGMYCFCQNYDLVKITIPKGIVTIGTGAFSRCSNCTELTIPDSVTSIGSSAFSSCSSLTSAIIGNSVTQIGDSAFSSCSLLESVTIPDSVTSIGSSAFSSCGSLTRITIPESVQSIGNSAFSNCIGDFTINSKIVETNYTSSSNPYTRWLRDAKFTKLIIGNSVTCIGNYAFYYNSYFTNAIIGDSVITIGDYAFRYCKSLTSITIPDSVTSIGSSAFENCTSLTSVTIPDSVTELGDNVFSNCTSLTSVVIGNGVTSIGYTAFGWCSSLTSVTIGDSVTSIGDHAFRACTLLSSINIPDSVISIGEYAFVGCSSLTNITIPNSVTSIGSSAFQNCTSLTSVTIPDSVTEIENGAFSSCKNLTSIYCKATTPPTLGGSSVFNQTPSSLKIYVPTASVSAYKAASGWSSYAGHIVGYDF